MNSVTQTPSTSTAKSKKNDDAPAVIPPFERATIYAGVRISPGKPDNTSSPMKGGYSPSPEDELLEDEIENEVLYEHENEEEERENNKKQEKKQRN
jgi:hypothetical protein